MAGATLEFTTSSPGATRAFGRALGGLLGPGAFVALTGDLGSGKTVVVQGVARGLGFRGRVTSPTFIIVREYRAEFVVYHVDLYRIENAGSLAGVGYREIFYGDGVTIVEWADRVPELLPDDRLDVRISVDGPTDRRFTVTACGPAHAALVRGLAEAARDGWADADSDC